MRALTLLLCLGSVPVLAQDREPAGYGASTESESKSASGTEASEEDGEGEAGTSTFGTTATVGAVTTESGDRARSAVTRQEMDERQPRSAPDALRWVPGVAVQQTAHAQASPYVRGLTGQRVVHVFDGVRLNTAIYRQGPNQYFFTIDEASVSRLEVLRGSASVVYGSDALGGVILAEPVRPHLGPVDGVEARPRLRLRYGSVDRELGGRAQLQLRWDDGALQVGAGYRDVDRLRGGGVVRHRTDRDGVGRGDVAPWVPRFAEEAERPIEEWRTQLGTGFREASFDARLDQRIARDLRAFAAVYGYRQMDAPRTDQCPAPEAPVDECLTIDRQWRTLAYGGLRGSAGPLRELSLTLSYQRHDERRRRERPRAGVRFRWNDEVHSLGAAFRATADLRRALPAVALRFGADGYRDDVRSDGEQAFTDLSPERVFELSRGQYLNDSHQVTLGAFAELAVRPLRWLTLRAGGRAQAIEVAAPGDLESGSSSVQRTFAAAVGRAGVAIEPERTYGFFLNLDQGFRAPNLDDLTGRQQVGPGFQFENAALQPERSLTTELGTRVSVDWLRFELWGFVTRITEGIQRVVREIDDCPPSTPDCLGSRDPFQLVNAPGASVIVGGESVATLLLPRRVTLRASVSYAWGEGPSLGDRFAPEGRVPLSRIPPAQGTFEGRWRHRATGLWVGAGLRWAAAQGRLAVSDASDPRIPDGGTPGYALVELRAGWRWKDWLHLALVAHNLGDVAYKVHGSSIVGPGRGVRLTLELGRR